jgi:hypothetical protein
VNIVDMAIMRGVLIFLIALEVMSIFFATIVTVAYKTGHLGLAAAMAGQMPGDDYRPFIPLMNAIPWWVYALWVSAGLLYLVAAGSLVTRQRRKAFSLFAGGFAVAIVAKLASDAIISAAGLQPIVPRAGTITGLMIQSIPEIILLLAIVSALFLIWRRQTAPGAPA